MRKHLAVFVILAVLTASPVLATDASPSTTPLRDSADRIVANVPPMSGFDGVKKPHRESFFGPTNLLMGAALFGSTVADVESSLSCFSATSTRRTTLPNGDVLVETEFCYEGNGSRGNDYASGRSAVYPKNLAFNGAVWTGSYFLRRSKSPFVKALGWVAPVMVTGLQAHLAISNRQVENKVRNFH
jgi:hypothetical protein